ncbi:MFS transporter [Lactobacillus nasalidis]|nr:MFS transporter [Lactobacillus nasalidis]
MNFKKALLFGLAACFLYGMGAGLRADIGILLQPIMKQTGLAYSQVSFSIALLQLVFGSSQPFFGILAAKRSNRFVLLTGVGLIICGLTGITFASSLPALIAFLSIVFGLGAGAVSFGLVFTSAACFVGPKYAMMISGMLNASAGMVGFVLSPLLNQLLAVGGLQLVVAAVAAAAALTLPVVFLVTSRDPGRGNEKEADLPESGAIFKEAFHSRTYRLLLAGFSTCGFHMVIIESHLFSQFKSYGISAAAASWAFSTYGIATIAGALLSGWLSGRLPKGRLLAFYYAFRAAWAAGYVFLLPKNFITAAVFAIGLGLTGDATVSPTSGLVNEEFSLGKVATLVGLLFLGHQIGAFASAWIGGILVDATGGYQLLWLIDSLLCLAAALASFRINEEDKKEIAE